MLTNECVINVKYWFTVLFIFIIEKLNLRITINVIRISILVHVFEKKLIIKRNLCTCLC